MTCRGIYGTILQLKDRLLAGPLGSVPLFRYYLFIAEMFQKLGGIYSMKKSNGCR